MNVRCRKCRDTKLAFTLIELLVVVAIIAVLIAVLLPALSRVREEARRVQCLSQLRQLGMAHLLYRDETGSFLARRWPPDPSCVLPHSLDLAGDAGAKRYFSLVSDATVFYCPSNQQLRGEAGEYVPGVAIWATYGYCFDAPNGFFKSPAARTVDPTGLDAGTPLMLDIECIQLGMWLPANHMSYGGGDYPAISNVVQADGHAQTFGPPTEIWWESSLYKFYWPAEVGDKVRSLMP